MKVVEEEKLCMYARKKRKEKSEGKSWPVIISTCSDKSLDGKGIARELLIRKWLKEILTWEIV